MLFRKLAIAVVGLALLSGCAVFQGEHAVDAVNKVQPTGSEFDRQLTAEYRDLANFEWNQMNDWFDGYHYAKKGLMASKGTLVMPEDPATRRLSSAKLSELQDARSRLLGAFDRGARERDPKTAAFAQAKYDCWVEQEEEGWQMDHIAACRGDFLKALAVLEGKKYVERPMVPTDSAAYLVFFDFDRAVITDAARDVLKTMMDDVRKNKIDTILVTGHTDTSGSTTYNQRLSERRAKAVKDELVSMGLSTDKVMTNAFGETQPLVSTGDGVREPSNRRGEIRFR